MYQALKVAKCPVPCIPPGLGTTRLGGGTTTHPPPPSSAPLPLRYPASPPIHLHMTVTAHCKPHTANRTQCSVFSVQCSVNTAFYTLHSANIDNYTQNMSLQYRPVYTICYALGTSKKPWEAKP